MKPRKNLEINEDDVLLEDTSIDFLLPKAEKHKKNQVKTAKPISVQQQKITKPKLVFIVGIEETEKDTIAEMVIKNNKELLPPIKYIKAGVFPKLDGISLKQMNEKKEMFLQKITKSIEGTKDKNILLSSHLVHKIESGYVPIFSGEFIAKTKPDFFIFFFVDTESLKAMGGKINVSDVKNRQDMNWECIKSYCLSGGIPVKIVRVVHGDLKSAMNTTSRIMKSIFG